MATTKSADNEQRDKQPPDYLQPLRSSIVFTGTRGRRAGQLGRTGPIHRLTFIGTTYHVYCVDKQTWINDKRSKEIQNEHSENRNYNL
jgi:hypothetical protein